MTTQALDRQHGTYGTYQWHTRNGVPVCDPCKEANRIYQAKRREDPDKMRLDVEDARANSRALWRLAKLHPNQFRALVSEERRKAGLTP